MQSLPCLLLISSADRELKIAQAILMSTIYAFEEAKHF
jgi:hypothetical protein